MSDGAAEVLVEGPDMILCLLGSGVVRGGTILFDIMLAASLMIDLRIALKASGLGREVEDPQALSPRPVTVLNMLRTLWRRIPWLLISSFRCRAVAEIPFDRCSEKSSFSALVQCLKMLQQGPLR